MNNIQQGDFRAEEERREKVIELRRLLGEKFSGALPKGFADESTEQATEKNRVPGGGKCCGIPGIDQLELPRGEITEVSVAPPEAGCGLVLSAVLGREIACGNPVALVDAGDCFDVSEIGEQVPVGLLLWVRCREERCSGKKRTAAERRDGGGLSGRVGKAIKVTDLLLRDGNINTVLIDLQACREQELRAIPKSTWFRLRSLAATTEARCLVFTPRPIVSSAAVRIDMAQRALSLSALDDRREDIHSVLAVRVLRDRRGQRDVEGNALLRVG